MSAKTIFWLALVMYILAFLYQLIYYFSDHKSVHLFLALGITLVSIVLYVKRQSLIEIISKKK